MQFVTYCLLFISTTLLFASPVAEVRDGSEVTKDGLPQNTITAIQQTSDGYMWLGTFNGLVRFDGIVFTTFNIENTPQFKSDHITYLKAFDDGSLWIGTFGGGLLKLQDNQFQNVNLGASFDRQTIVSILKINQEDSKFYVLGHRGLFQTALGDPIHKTYYLPD